jgi:hypothetical protein
MLEFLVDVDTANREDLILSLGEQVFQFALEERVYRLGIMLKGGGSFTDMSRSPLAVFESEATHAPLKNKAMKRLFNQPITTSTTPDMKDLIRKRKLQNWQTQSIQKQGKLCGLPLGRKIPFFQLIW